MLFHILNWSYRENVSNEDRARIEAELEGLRGKVPSLRGLHWGTVVGGRNQSFSHCFVMLFEDKGGLDEYAVHPDHIRFAGLFREACATQVVVDFEVQSATPVA